MSKTYSAGIVTAYGAAKRAGYQGTYEDFCRQQAGYAENAAAVEQAKTDAVNAKNDAISAKNTAVSAKDDAVIAKDVAVAKSSEASASATNASQSATSAGQSATSASQSATSAETSAANAHGFALDAEQSAQDISASVQQIATNTAEISQIKADLGDKLDAYLNVDFSIDNKRVNSMGSITVSNGQRITDYYPCLEGTVVKWHGRSFIYGSASVMCLIAFFDADKAFITGITSVSGETTSVIGDVSAIAPAGTAYVVGSTTSVANCYLHVYDVNIARMQNESHEAYINVDQLKSDLDAHLSMIAPVEVTYTATRNYTVGQLLIVDNVLYKVTSNIANGGTITAGTNVLATTLSEVIASLS